MQTRSISRVLSLALCLLSLCAGATAQRSKAPKKPRPGRPATIVFVGNSYTHFHDLPAMLRALGRAAQPPRELTTVMVAPGGFTLEGHVAAEGAESAIQKITATRPDFVVLQEQSQRPFLDPDKMEKAAAELVKVVKKAKATPVWYMTWARQDEPARQEAISAQYERLHEQLGGELGPVGRAFQLLRAERDDLTLHVPDKSHPSPAGSYLAASVLYGAMFGDDVTRFPDVLRAEPGGGKPSEAKVLVEVSAADGVRLRAAAAAALRGEKPAAKQQPAEQAPGKSPGKAPAEAGKQAGGG